MEIKVREVSGSEEKSKQEIELKSINVSIINF